MISLEELNQRLVDHYGIDSDTGRPMFRIVWADDQLEKRLVDRLDNGILLLYEQVMEVKKYPFFRGFYVLERLVIIPDVNQRELPVSKLSYEPLWVYRDANMQPLPPIWEATKFVIDTLYAALGKKSLAKYKEDAQQLSQEAKTARVDKIYEELFGNETEVTDALAYNEGVVVPGIKEES